MITISAAIYEKTPREIFKLLKPCVSRSGINKVLKRLGETDSTLPMVRSTPSPRIRTPNLYIFFGTVCLFVCYSRSPLPPDQPWQMRYQKKANNSGKVKIF